MPTTPQSTGADVTAPASTCRRPGPADPQERAAHGREDLAAILMGYDSTRDRRPVIDDYLACPRRAPRGRRRRRVRRDRAPRFFADLAELSRNRPAGEDLHTELRVHSSKEHFHAYLQSLDVDRGGLPDQFRDRLARVLGHYGVTDRTGRRSWRRRCSASSWRSSGRHPTYSWRPSSSSAGSLSLRRASSSPARRATSSSASSGPRSPGSRRSATSPGAPASTGSTSRWSTLSVPPSLPASATRSRLSLPIPTLPTGPDGWTRHALHADDSRRHPGEPGG